MASNVESRAFEHAFLRTERLRTVGVIVTILVFGATAAVRIYLFGSHMTHIGLYASIAFVTYELLVLRAVDASVRSEKRIPNWLWTLNVAIEMTIPALGLAFLVTDRIPAEYRALASSWVLLFFPFLILSTLRLSFRDSMIAGVTGTVGYLLAARHHGWHIKPDLLSNPVTHSAVPFVAVMICATGLVAALVAREIRGHVQAALREAETERRLKQMQHDLSIARSIQRSLLPKIRPRIDGYEIAGWNRSADATGGDYFDWTQLGDGRLAVTLADVTGHGIGPALLASVCRAYARACFAKSDSLADTLQSLNHSLGEDLLPGRVATFVAAVCRAGDDKVELLSAGHGPLFWYSNADQSLQSFPAHDVPLGILPRLTAKSAQVLSLKEGDIVLLVTDGFLEWEDSAGEQFGNDRFEEVVRSACHLGPEDIIAELYNAVLKFADGSPQQDDLTAVVIKRVATPTTVVASAA